MLYPQVEVDLSKIYSNTEKMINRLREKGIEISAVSKLYGSDTTIVKTLLSAGIQTIADSRISNLKKLEEFDCQKWLLRIPMISELDDVIKYTTTSLMSSIEVIRILNDKCNKANIVYPIILMIDVGDLREGLFYQEEIIKVTEEILGMNNIKLVGLGTNVSCVGSIDATPKNTSILCETKKLLEDKFNIKLDIISGGASTSLHLFENDTLPSCVNNLRIGTALALGLGFRDLEIPFLEQNAFKLKVEIVELQTKPSKPIGTYGVNAYGETCSFIDHGIIPRAICALGRQDMDCCDLITIDENIEVFGCSSDHLVLNLLTDNHGYKVGDIVEFNLTYRGILTLMTSSYVNTTFINEHIIKN